MGQLAHGMGVTPGTATTMVKALAESGLVHYEPYAGVRLTPAGERLAGTRHPATSTGRAVSGPGDGHAAGTKCTTRPSKLEHVVSERLIERMDEMLGRPQVDPHGDPIPDATARSRTRAAHAADLPLARAADGDARDRSGRGVPALSRDARLKPGQQVVVEARDEVADSVSRACQRCGPLTHRGARRVEAAGRSDGGCPRSCSASAGAVRTRRLPTLRLPAPSDSIAPLGD